MNITPPTNALEPDPREVNLPKWAQATLRQLRLELSETSRSMVAARLETKPTETDTVLDYYSKYPIGLARGAMVTFQELAGLDFQDAAEWRKQAATPDGGAT